MERTRTVKKFICALEHKHEHKSEVTECNHVQSEENKWKHKIELKKLDLQIEEAKLLQLYIAAIQNRKTNQLSISLPPLFNRTMQDIWGKSRLKLITDGTEEERDTDDDDDYEDEEEEEEEEEEEKKKNHKRNRVEQKSNKPKKKRKIVHEEDDDWGGDAEDEDDNQDKGCSKMRKKKRILAEKKSNK